ncbi:MAG: ABC transporter substrate-binding protein [Hyphomicrobiales bacterium]|nr:ABC transporter substrate-binding protein [Hyphomicrobiales bacterium]
MRKISAATAAVFAMGLTGGVAQAADPLKIGVLLPTSGFLASLGKEQTNAMKLAVEMAGGSVAGRKIELLFEDTEAKPPVGQTKLRKLILSDKVDVTAGVVSSAVALAITPYLSRMKMPLVISNAGTNLLSGAKCNRYVLRASYSMAQSSEPIGKYMAKKGIKSVYILAADYVAPREAVEAFKKAFIAGGGKVLGEIWTPFGRTQDFGPFISKARAAKPDAIFPVYYGGEAILFAKQYEAFGLKKSIPLFSALGYTPRMLHRAQGDTALGVIQSSNYVAELPHPENKAFVEAYSKKYGLLPSEFAAYAFDTINVILAGVKARKGDTKDKAALVAAMEKVSFTGPRGPIKFSSSSRGITQNWYIVNTVKKDGKIAFDVLDTYKDYADPISGCKLK